MKKIIIGVLGLAIVAFFAFKGEGDKHTDIALGDKAPKAELEMKNTNGEMASLQSEKGENGLLVVFSCNTCPFVIAWEDQYPELYELCAANNVGMIAINSNEAKRDGDDSWKAMKVKAKADKYQFAYVVDTDSELAYAFGATRTPHIYLFDGDMKLTFKGAINDKYENKTKTAGKHYLKDAIGKMVNGEKID
ncbi:MAG: redoxin domain-containing protein, partial [Bacteroidia bacterium]|nr:redoxin domain-containing protein [Bacteroidia bacterium]